MSKGTRETTVGAHGYRIRRLPPFDSLELLGNLQRKLVAPFLAVLDGVPAGDEGRFKAQLAGGLERVLRGLDGKELRALCKELLQPDYVFIVPEGGDKAEKFTETAATQHGLDVTDLIELCVEVIRHNYEDFLPRAAARFGLDLRQLAARFQVPSDQN